MMIDRRLEDVRVAKCLLAWTMQFPLDTIEQAVVSMNRSRRDVIEDETEKL